MISRRGSHGGCCILYIGKEPETLNPDPEAARRRPAGGFAEVKKFRTLP